MGGFDNIRENIRNRRMPMASTKKIIGRSGGLRLPTNLILTADELRRDLSRGIIPQQLTREQAIFIGESKMWESWTDDQIVRLQLFQENIAIPFPQYHAALSRVLGRPILTHEFSSAGTPHLQREYLKIESARTPGEILRNFKIGEG
jgi:hypothetical protein